MINTCYQKLAHYAVSWTAEINSALGNVHKFSFSLTRRHFLLAAAFDLCLILYILALGVPNKELISPLSYSGPAVVKAAAKYEVFGFAPYWSLDRMSNVDFSVLTTLAYFGVDVNSNGGLDRESVGYRTFVGRDATDLFDKAHSHGTKVVLTLTQMNNRDIENFLYGVDAQNNAIDQVIAEVKDRGIDGVNVDFEYVGDPGAAYRGYFSDFVANLTERMHSEVPGSKVTVSVYASAVRDSKLYDIKKLGTSTDGIFMMAYDFATYSAKNAMPTSPLFGYKEGKYWYDVSTAVDDFLTQTTPDKVILGLPWYGYDYAVRAPEVLASVNQGYYVYYGKGRKRYKRFVKLPVKVQQYGNGIGNSTELSGWDEAGQVGWKAYYSSWDQSWRMYFQEDVRSLGLKYDFAKDKNLAGVGVWALGFDNETRDMWELLSEKFSAKDVAQKGI